MKPRILKSLNITKKNTDKFVKFVSTSIGCAIKFSIFPFFFKLVEVTP